MRFAGMQAGNAIGDDDGTERRLTATFAIDVEAHLGINYRLTRIFTGVDKHAATHCAASRFTMS